MLITRFAGKVKISFPIRYSPATFESTACVLARARLEAVTTVKCKVGYRRMSVLNPSHAPLSC